MERRPSDFGRQTSDFQGLVLRHKPKELQHDAEALISKIDDRSLTARGLTAEVRRLP